MQNKSIIQQELEKWIESYKKNINTYKVLLGKYPNFLAIIQKTLEELKKEKYCKQCGSNDEHSISCNSITRGYVYDEEDVEKYFEVKDAKNK